jgi:hypothetical protein
LIHTCAARFQQELDKLLWYSCLARIPRSNICVTGNSSLGFHLAKSARYPAAIQAWINARGGLKGDFVRLRSPELNKYFGKC